MPRVALIDWDPAGAGEHAARLRDAGYAVSVQTPRGMNDVRALGDSHPDAVIIDLSRLPAQGREVAAALRRRKASRDIPIVFAAGDPEKVERVRALLPDAVYSNWDEIAGAVHNALWTPRDTPVVVPGTMDAYSGAPLPKKLGIREGITVSLLGAPDGFDEKLGARTVARGAAHLVLLFAASEAELQKRFDAAARRFENGLWICWPKKASRIATDLSEAAVRKFGLARGLVDYKICAIDDTWSGLLFTRRRK